MKKIFYIIIIIIISIISVYAAASYQASEIEYKGTTLDLALDELYDNANNTINNLNNQLNNISVNNQMTVKSHDTYGVRLESRTATVSSLASGKYIASADYSVIGYGNADSTSSSSGKTNFRNSSISNSNCTNLYGLTSKSFSSEAANNQYANQDYHKFLWLCNFSSTSNVSVTRTEQYPNNINTQMLNLTTVKLPNIDMTINSSSVKYNVSNGTRSSSRTATISNLTSGKYLFIGNNLYRDFKSSVYPNSYTTPKLSTTKTSTICNLLNNSYHIANGTQATNNVYESHFFDNTIWVCDLKESDSISLTRSASASNQHSQSLSLMSVKLN